MDIDCKIRLKFKDKFVDVDGFFDIRDGDQELKGGVPYDIIGSVEESYKETGWPTRKCF